ncbi:C-Jun-amino-terminal kinase-interacting protein 4 isoform X2 [Alligator mississippiensis]|uniref:C-Jun-amino-terminal kinase-interacting protein 4 isoform X2 n=1 Tax=Alligator mississippiensis TaxID=8496 RepID=UPI0009073EAF|nr:C-Jun-amino-terminal kinase-interacting protein 4 isoform X2 [Alligator mississippiensis]
MEALEEEFGGEGEQGTSGADEGLVGALAAGLYGELERLVGAYGPAVVAGLLPQLVAALEGLEQAGRQLQDQDHALAALHEDQARLLSQYERERAGRARAEERYMELEDAVEQEQKGHRAVLTLLEGQSRLLEGKARAYADQVASLEEQKAALLKELSALGQTHSKVVKSYKELRAQKLPLPRPSVPQPSSIPEPPQPAPSLLEPRCPQPYAFCKGSVEDPDTTLPPVSIETPEDGQRCPRNSRPLSQELPLLEGNGHLELCQHTELDEIVRSTPELKPQPELLSSTSDPMPPEDLERNTTSLFAEVSGLGLELIEALDDGADLQGDAIQALIKENANLREVRHELEVARRHLVARVEELSAERETLRGECDTASRTLGRCQARLDETEAALARLRQELEETKKQNNDAEAEAPASQRKRFTRAEMARVLTERNLYKERFMELQEAVRRTELLRASRKVQAAQMKKSSFWKIFDRLFSPGDSPEQAPVQATMLGRSGPRSSTTIDPRWNSGQTPTVVRYVSCSASPTNSVESPSLSPQQQKRDLYRQIRTHIWREHGRAQVHGWSLPHPHQGTNETSGSNKDVPRLLQLRLLDQKDPSTKLWCAASAGVLGPDVSDSAVPASLVWVCSGTPSASEVMVLDVTRPNHVLDQFVLPHAHVVCAAWLPGYQVSMEQSTELSPEILDDPLAPRSPEEEEVEEGIADTGIARTAATMWLGTQEGSIFVYSAVSNWRQCLSKVQLKDAVHSIVHAQGHVVAALGDGTLAIFHRNDAQCWDLAHPHLLDLGRPHQSICCALAVGVRIWCGYRNCIHVVEPRGARIKRSFVVTSRPESQVRHMVLAGAGVWVSVQLDPILRLFHAGTGQPLQEVDLEPLIHGIFGPTTLGFSLQVSALGAFAQRLWVGTASGTILTLPFAPEFTGDSEAAIAPGSQPSPLPASAQYCAMEQAQASYHGHRDAVRFLICVPVSFLL